MGYTKQKYVKYGKKNIKSGKGEEKCRMVRTGLNLRDHQLKIIIYTLLHMNLMVTINLRPITDIHNIHKEESKHNTDDSHQITREEIKRRRKEHQHNHHHQNYKSNWKIINKMAVKYMPMNNYFKCKWKKCCNQKT